MKDKRKRILVLDDEEALRTVLSIELEGEGYEPFSFCSKAYGYDWTIKNRPDLIISDIKSPGMDGLQFIRWIKGNPLTQKVPFLFVTGFADLKTAILSKRLGASDFVSKPYDLVDLLAVVSRILEVEWSPSLYPFDFDTTEESYTKFRPWSELERRIIQVLERQARRTAVLDTSSEWRIFFLLEEKKNLVGGWFCRPYEFGGFSQRELVWYREYLDEHNLNSGMVCSFFEPAPLTRELARLLGIWFHPPRLLQKVFSEYMKLTDSLDLLGDLNSRQIALMTPDHRFREFTEGLLEEIVDLNGSEYEIIVEKPKKRKIRVLQEKRWDGGLFFSNKDDQYYAWISSEYLWLSFTKIWLTGRYRRGDIVLEEDSEQLLIMLLGRLSAFQLRGHSEVIYTPG